MSNETSMGVYNIRHVEGESNYRLLERGEFELWARDYNEGICFVPDGDGWAPDPKEWRWNGLSNPLDNRIKLRGSRKQVAARAYIKHESRDDKEVFLPITDDGQLVSLGRNQGEASPAAFGTRGTNWSQGEKYSGGQRAVKAAMREQKKYLEAKPAKPSAREEREAKIADLTRQVRELMGLLKK